MPSTQDSYIAASKSFYERGGFYTANPLGVQGRVWFVDTNLGSNSSGRSNQGRLPGTGSYLTMAKALSMCDTFDLISVAGVIREQVISPVGVYDVRIVGAAGRPRQATDNGVATGGGTSWITPASPTATTALLKLIQAGWSVENIFFAPVASSSCVTIQRAAASGSVAEKDGSHASIINCKFAGGGSAGNGILFLDGGYNCLIQGNMFESLAGTAILSSGTGVSVPAENVIADNYFNACTNSIAISSVEGKILRNVIRQATNDSANKVNLISVSSQGSNNMVIDNVFSDAAANVAIAKGYKPGTGDVWRNFVTDTAAYIVTVPA